MFNKKESNKKIVAYLRDFKKMDFAKDVFLIPYYIAKEKKMPMTLYYGINKGDIEIPILYRDAQIISCGHKSISDIKEFLDALWYLIPKANQIDTLFVVGISFLHMLRVWIIKHINPNINIILFGDIEPKNAEDLKNNGTPSKNIISKQIKNKFANYFFRNTICLVANPLSYKYMKDLYIKKKWKGLLHFWPCIDDETTNSLNISRPRLNQKEKIILYVGRIGNYQKNTEMLLEALPKVDLKDWYIYMIGPITSDFTIGHKCEFNTIIEDFFKNNPHYVGKILFNGVIYNTEELFNFYKRAKVFILTSRHESFGNVLSEAAAMGCYIVSTDVGGASLVSNNWKYGTKLKQDDSDNLANVINEIINERIEINECNMMPFEDLCYSNNTRKIIIPNLYYEKNS